MSVNRQPTIIQNSLEVLAEENSTELDVEALDALNGGAHEDSRSSRKLSKLVNVPKTLDVFGRVTIRSERDLDAALQAHPQTCCHPGLSLDLWQEAPKEVFFPSFSSKNAGRYGASRARWDAR